MNRLLSFTIFISSFLTLYGLLHFYFYRKLTKAIEMSAMGKLLVLIALCFLLLSPICAYSLTRTEHFLLTYVLTYAAFIWMGSLFLFFAVNFVIDVYSVIIHISHRIVSLDLLRYIPGNRATFMITLIFVAGIDIYGRFEAENIRVKRIELSTTKLPPHVNSLRIAQISDIHFSTLNGLKLARKIEGIINDLQPDILISTGDLIDRGLQDKKGVASVLKGIKTEYGKFAITGNHEFISGIQEAVRFTEKAGFRMLRNEGITVGGFIDLAGIDDPAASRFGNPYPSSERNVLQSFSPDKLSIFLKHQPRIEDSSIGKFDLQLSGHTHGGQIYPFTLLSSLFYPYQKGLFDLGKGVYLYVSRGTGTWGPPIRFLSFPEITLIDFRKK